MVESDHVEKLAVPSKLGELEMSVPLEEGESRDGLFPLCLSEVMHVSTSYYKKKKKKK